MTEKKYHFISGLPRSGSTLLSAILSQNPRFHASVTSPVSRIVTGVHDVTTSPEYGVLFNHEKRERMLKEAVDSYYRDQSKDVIFDTNRTWTGRVPLLMKLYPHARIICCVREIGWVIDSLEHIMAKHPLDSAVMFRPTPGATLYSRVETIMNANTGFVGLPWTLLREAWHGPHAGRLVIVPYEHLVSQPKRTIERLYASLGETLFEHDFDHVGYEYPEYDVQIGIPEMHKVRQKVQAEKRQTILPPDLFNKYASTQFWDQAGANVKHVQII